MNLKSLPEDCLLEEIHHHLYVLMKIGTPKERGNP
jgi:hypothetical protein